MAGKTIRSNKLRPRANISPRSIFHLKICGKIFCRQFIGAEFLPPNKSEKIGTGKIFQRPLI